MELNDQTAKNRSSIVRVAIGGLLILGTISNAHSQTLRPTTSTLKTSAPKETTPSRSWQPQLNVKLYGRGISDEIEESRVTGINILGAVQYDVEDVLNFKIAAGVTAEAGSSHALFETNQPRNTVYLDEAKTEFIPFSFFSLEGGAINQRSLNNPLLIDDQPFPAARENILIGNQDAGITLQAQQAVPVSSSLSTMTSEREKLPQFFTETVHFKAKNSSGFAATIGGGHYQFKNLPSQVALDSAAFGNTVDAQNAQNARFNYEYAGWTGDAGLALPIGSATARTGAVFLVNTAAPSDRNKGYLTYGEVEMKLTKKWTIAPHAEWFVNERDTSPAYYNIASIGHNNRQGYAAELRLKHLPSDTVIKGRFVDSRLLQEDTLQVDTYFVFITVEMLNVF